jgi:hypothetical protein
MEAEMDNPRSTPDKGPRRGIPTGTLVAGGFVLLLIAIGILSVLFRTGVVSMPEMDMENDSTVSPASATEDAMDLPGMDVRPVDAADARPADLEEVGNPPLEPTIAEVEQLHMNEERSSLC